MGVRGCVLRPTGHSLVTLFLYLCRLRNVRYISLEAIHRFIILSTYLLMREGKLVALLSWVPALSRPTDWRRGWGRSKHHTVSRTQVWGLESKFGWGPRPLNRELWVGLACAWGTSEAYVLGYPAGIHWFMNRRMMRYDLAMV